MIGKSRMQSEITSEKVKSALRQVKFPHSKDNIVDDGDVSGIVIKDGHIGFSIEIDPALANQSDELRREAEDVVSSLSGVLSATAILTAHKAASTSQPPPRSKPEAPRNPPLKPAKHVIAVASGKGGVGKSTTAINIALALKQMGLLVGILDADIYGPNQHLLFDIERKKPEIITIRDKKYFKPIISHNVKVNSMGLILDSDKAALWRGPMLSGAIIGYRGLISGLLMQLRKELGTRKMPVVATGGYAKLIAKKISAIKQVDPLLTIEGLRLVGQKHRPKWWKN